jgi:hypothetical protein
MTCSSVPLHAAKGRILNYIYISIDNEGLSIYRVFWVGLKATLEVCTILGENYLFQLALDKNS